MKKAIVTQLPAALTVCGGADPVVQKAIKAAGAAGNTMLAQCKVAAQAAVKQVNPELGFRERVGSIMTMYAEDFTKAGHNVRSIFGDCLVLLLAPTVAITVDKIVKGEKREHHCEAAEALALPKHALRDAAKQVREEKGIGRKTAKATVKSPSKVVDTTAESAFQAWLANAEYLVDVAHHTQVVSRFAELGYVLSKAVKGRKVTGKAST